MIKFLNSILLLSLIIVITACNNIGNSTNNLSSGGSFTEHELEISLAHFAQMDTAFKDIHSIKVAILNERTQESLVFELPIDKPLKLADNLINLKDTYTIISNGVANILNGAYFIGVDKHKYKLPDSKQIKVYLTESYCTIPTLVNIEGTFEQDIIGKLSVIPEEYNPSIDIAPNNFVYVDQHLTSSLFKKLFFNKQKVHLISKEVQSPHSFNILPQQSITNDLRNISIVVVEHNI